MALCQGQHVGASGDEGLLVGQADVLSSFDGGAGGLQPSTADDACRQTQEEAGDTRSRGRCSSSVPGSSAGDSVSPGSLAHM